jgi:hypothetical protein
MDEKSKRISDLESGIGVFNSIFGSYTCTELQIQQRD